nr:MAG TPA: hypothetical protein [Caudoviricetes sp.]
MSSNHLLSVYAFLGTDKSDNTHACGNKTLNTNFIFNHQFCNTPI